MKTSAGIIATAGVGLAQRLFSRVLSVLSILVPVAITPQLAPLPGKGRAKLSGLLMSAALLTLVSLALLAPRARHRPETASCSL